MKRNIVLGVPLVIAIATASLFAQTPSDPAVVYLRASAIEKNGRFVTGLRQEAFKILEDNDAQNISFFSSDEAAQSLALLIDADAATRDQVRETALTGLKKAISTSEEIFLVDSKNAPLNDAVYDALNQLLQRPSNKRSLILFTTRDKPESRSFAKVKELLKDQDLRLHVISLPSQIPGAGETANPLLRELAEISGGTAFFPSSMTRILAVFETIARDLKYEYVLGYHPSNTAADGKWRKIKVRAEHPLPNGRMQTFEVRTKAGYYAPTKLQR